jgi:uncharacterized membrane protein (DUF4010 family)
VSPTLELLLSIAIPLTFGLIIGIERESAGVSGGRGLVGGVRTFALIALAGAVCGYLSSVIGEWLIGVGLAVMGGLAVVSRYRETASEDGAGGMASEVAAVVTFLLGVTATATALAPDPIARFQLTAAVGIGVVALLALREPLHSLASKVTREDMYATVRFTLLAIVLLPLLPNETYGPLDVLNPLHIGTMVVFVAGISFAGYVAMRVMGSRKGLLATGLIGGLVSSTAVTASLSRRAREVPEALSVVAIAVIAACSTMFLRVVVELAVVAPSLLPRVAPPMSAMTLGGVLFAIGLHRRASHDGTAEEVEIRNPFELRSALQFGLLFAIVVFAAKAADTYLGDKGLYLSALVAGTTDVDAITLSVASLAQKGLEAEVAANAIFIAAVSNTVVKIGIAAWLGRGRFAKRVLLGLVVAMLAGVAALGIQLALSKSSGTTATGEEQAAASSVPTLGMNSRSAALRLREPHTSMHARSSSAS